MKKTRAMHATAQRLYLAAETIKKITRPKALADLLGIENQQTLNNWEKRGVSAEGMLLAQEKIGCNATWIESGKGEMSLEAMTHAPSVADLLGMLRAKLQGEPPGMRGGFAVMIEKCLNELSDEESQALAKYIAEKLEKKG